MGPPPALAASRRWAAAAAGARLVATGGTATKAAPSPPLRGLFRGRPLPLPRGRGSRGSRSWPAGPPALPDAPVNLPSPAAATQSSRLSSPSLGASGPRSDLGGGWHNASLHSSNAPAAERADSGPRRLAPRATPQSSESSLLGPLWDMATRAGKPSRDVRWQVPRAKAARVVRVLAAAWRLWQRWC